MIFNWMGLRKKIPDHVTEIAVDYVGDTPVFRLRWDDGELLPVNLNLIPNFRPDFKEVAEKI